MTEPSYYDGKTDRRDNYVVFKDDEGYGVRNTTKEIRLPPRWSQRKYAMKWIFHIKKFKWTGKHRKIYAALDTAVTRLKAGVGARMYAMLWFFNFCAEKRDPELTDDEYEEYCIKLARRQLRIFARRGLMRMELKDNAERWFIEPAGQKWLEDANEFSNFLPRPDLPQRKAG